MYKYIEPEVSGSLGEDTIINNNVHPPIISKLHYHFSGWLGDDIIETFPCYLVTDRLKKAIESKKLTGVNFDENLIVTINDEFKELYPNKELPKFHWLKVNGEVLKDDFCIAEDYRLLISSEALNVLNKFKIEQADLENYD